MTDLPSSHHELLERLHTLPALLAADRHLQHRGRFASCAFMIGIGDVPFHVNLQNGKIASFVRGPIIMGSWHFALHGQPEAWNEFWQATPRAGFHDIFALTKSGLFVLEGDLLPFMSNLLFFKELLALPRKSGSLAQ